MRLAAASVLLVSSLAPPALADEGLAGPVAEVVAAERAFARRAGEAGLRAAFLEWFAEGGVSFAPGPGDARERWEQRPALAPGEKASITLVWAPAEAEAALAGDLGWTTGPYLLTAVDGKRPPSSGTYFSVWRRQPAGAWKVVLDLGVESPAAPLPEVARAAGPAGPRRGGRGTAQAADLAFCARLATRGGRAYAEALAPGARVHRDGQAPLVGAAAWRPWTAGLAGVYSCKPESGGTASQADLGYAYGSWEHRAKPGGEVVAKGYYARVWRWERSTWRIAIDVAPETR